MLAFTTVQNFIECFTIFKHMDPRIFDYTDGPQGGPFIVITSVILLMTWLVQFIFSATVRDRHRRRRMEEDNFGTHTNFFYVYLPIMALYTSIDLFILMQCTFNYPFFIISLIVYTIVIVIKIANSVEGNQSLFGGVATIQLWYEEKILNTETYVYSFIKSYTTLLKIRKAQNKYL